MPADLRETRARFVKGPDYIRNAGISPSGARAVFEFRGEIVTVPAEKGDPRNLTNTMAAHERSPQWSPDGTRVAYFSDESGEYELHVRSHDGKGDVRRFKLNGAGFYFDPALVALQPEDRLRRQFADGVRPRRGDRRDQEGGRQQGLLRREEWAVTAEDILYRRTKLGLHVPTDGEARLDEWLGHERLP